MEYRRGSKVCQEKVGRMRLIMGQDVVVKHVKLYQTTALVGKFHSTLIFDKSMGMWVRKSESNSLDML